MARTRRYHIRLSRKERKDLRRLQKKAVSANARARYAILLSADESQYRDPPLNRDIAAMSGASIPTVIDTIRKYCESGLEAAIHPERNPHSDTARLKATGEVKAKIVAKACTSALTDMPDGC